MPERGFALHDNNYNAALGIGKPLGDNLIAISLN